MDLIDRERLKEVFKRNTGYDYADLIDMAPTVDAIPIGKVMNMIDEIQAEIEKYNSDRRWALSERDEKCMRCTDITFSRIQFIINEKVKGYKS